MGLCFRLAKPAEVLPFVTQLVERVRTDRMSYDRTTAEQRGFKPFPLQPA